MCSGWWCCAVCGGPSGVRVGCEGLLSYLTGTKEVSSRLKAEPTSPSLTKVFKLKVTNLLTLQKFWEISRQIHEFMTWTQVECPFEKDKKIQSYLLTAPIYSEEGEGHHLQPPAQTHTVKVTLTRGALPGYSHATLGKLSSQGRVHEGGLRADGR